MKSMLTCVLISAAAIISHGAFAQSQGETECVYKQRSGIGNLFELLGILNATIADRRSCDSSRTRADWEELDDHYNQFQSGDIDYRSKFTEQISTRASTIFDALGQVTESEVSVGAQTTNNQKAKIATVRGFHTKAGSE